MAKKYTKDHEWVESTTGNVVRVGITDHAQEQLGDIVFIDLPAIGKNFSKGDEMAVLESVKAASEIYMPLDGEIVAVNDALNDNAALINSGAEGKGWVVEIKLSDESALEGLLDEAAYKALIS